MRRAVICTLMVCCVVFGGTWAAAQQSVVYRAGIMVSKDYPFTKGVQFLADKMRERTNGRVKIDVFTDGALGTEPEMFEQVKAGGLDLVVISPGYLGPYFREMDLFDLPFLFRSQAHRDAVATGPIGQRYAENIEKKLKVVVLGYFGGSVRNVICRSKVVNSIGDLQGVKMRLQQSTSIIDSWKAAGAVPVVLAYPEVYLALQTGVVECAENESLTFTTAKWAEAAKSMALTQHSYTIRPLIMNADRLAKLSPEDQATMRATAREAAQFENKLEVEQDKEAVALLKSKFGVKMSTPDTKPFIERTAPVRQAFAKTAGVEAALQDIYNSAK